MIYPESNKRQDFVESHDQPLLEGAQKRENKDLEQENKYIVFYQTICTLRDKIWRNIIPNLSGINFYRIEGTHKRQFTPTKY